MAESLVSFKIPVIKEKLVGLLTNMYDFLETSYKGFYCSLCDSEAEYFIRTKSKRIVIKRKFCRNMIADSFVALNYLHNHFYDYINLQTLFLESCDFNGNYTKVTVPKNQIFNKNITNSDLIINCEKEVNTVHWFAFCRPLCEKYHPSKLENFFYPEIQKFQELNNFLAKKIGKRALDEEKYI